MNGLTVRAINSSNMALLKCRDNLLFANARILRVETVMRGLGINAYVGSFSSLDELETFTIGHQTNSMHSEVFRFGN